MGGNSGLLSLWSTSHVPEPSNISARSRTHDGELAVMKPPCLCNVGQESLPEKNHTQTTLAYACTKTFKNGNVQAHTGRQILSDG